ncbi:MAG: hypothetical protein HYT90_05290 [Candidatus Omnitrophica bacterium]|nr:hypothetical protein [Candidatus Omnitrophota bacterium]
MRQLGIAVAFVVGVGAASALADSEHMAPVAAPSADLERVKQLAGRWEGTSQEGQGEATPASIEYKVTSGGSAVVETLFPGTPHEMVSVYHDVGGKLSLTHYCMLGNQPELSLVSADGGSMSFSLSPSSPIQASEPHMGALTLTQDGAGGLTQVWTATINGQPAPATTIRVKRAGS